MGGGRGAIFIWMFFHAFNNNFLNEEIYVKHLVMSFIFNSFKFWFMVGNMCTRLQVICGPERGINFKFSGMLLRILLADGNTFHFSEQHMIQFSSFTSFLVEKC